MAEKFLTFSKDYDNALGGLVIVANEVEFTMLYCITRLLYGVNYTKRDFNTILCLAGSENFDVVLSKLDKLIRTFFPDNEPLIDSFLKIKISLDNGNKKRNKYIHSSWSPSENGLASRLKLLRAMKDKKLYDTEKNVNIQDIINATYEFEAATDSLLDFMNTLDKENPNEENTTQAPQEN